MHRHRSGLNKKAKRKIREDLAYNLKSGKQSGHKININKINIKMEGLS